MDGTGQTVVQVRLEGRAGHRAELPVWLEEVPEAETPLGAPQVWPLWVWAFFSTGKTLTCPDLSPRVRSSSWSLSQYGCEISSLLIPELGIQGPLELPSQQLCTITPASSHRNFWKVASWWLGSMEEELEAQLGKTGSGRKQGWALGIREKQSLREEDDV